MLHDRSTSCPETASQMVYHVAQQQLVILVAQEQTQAFPYLLLYAAYIIFERIQRELLQARYTDKDISKREQEQITKESLLAAGYHEILA